MSGSPFISKSYFDIQPLNSVSNFSFKAGQNVIRFSIPPMPNALLNDVLFCCKLNLDTDDNETPYNFSAAYNGTDADSLKIGADSVIAAHSIINKVEISTRRGNINLEQQNDYAMVAKLDQSSISSNNDLNVGRDNNMNICSSNNGHTLKRLVRTADGGVDLALSLNCGLLMKADSRIDLGQIGGLEIMIYLNSELNSFFNVDTDTFKQMPADFDIKYRLSGVHMFGSYQMYNPAIASQFQIVNFKKTANNMQVIQSSNDTNGFSPQVQSLDKMFIVGQPNNFAKNNFNSNANMMDQIVGLKNYSFSKDGLRFPYDFNVKVNESIANMSTAGGKLLTENVVSGSAEQMYNLCIASQGRYPAFHSLINMNNEADANEQLNDGATAPDNYFSTAFLPIGVSYQYGFAGYNTNMSNNLVQMNINSSIKTNDSNVKSTFRDQAYTQNNLFIYNATLDYANLQVMS